MRTRTRLEVVWQDERIACELHRSQRGGRNLTLRVRGDGSVRVGAPRGVKLAEIRAFVAQHAGWIARERRVLRDLAPRYVTGASQRYLGKNLRLVVARAHGRGCITLVDGELRVSLARNDEASVRARLNHWYRERAEEVFAARRARLMAAIDWLPVQPVWRQRRMRSQWGSCSPSGDVTLNTHLVKASPELIDYVILHELCHLVHQDHAAGFQRLMDAHMPDWRERRRALNSDTGLLLAD